MLTRESVGYTYWEQDDRRRNREANRTRKSEREGERGEYGQSLPRRRGGPVINIPYPLCLGLPLRRGTGTPYLVKTLLLLPTPTSLQGEPGRNP